MEYRTKPSIQAGVIENHATGKSRVLNYQPGNGTRYLLVFTPISAGSEAGALLGLMDEEGWVVTWISHRSHTLVCSQKALLHWSDVALGFQTTKSDAVVLAEVIGHVTSIRASTLEEVLRADALQHLSVIEGS